VGVARETVTVVIDGVPQALEIVRQEKIHGQQAFWACPSCQTLRAHLYWRQGVLWCRVCHRLTYESRRTGNTAALRAAKLRRRLGGLPSLLAPLPERPKYWRPDYYARWLGELLAAEAVLIGRLHAMVDPRRRTHERRRARAA
jgi:hypothetical protein